MNNEKMLQAAKKVLRDEHNYNRATGFTQKSNLVMPLRRDKNHLRSKFLEHEHVVQIFESEEVKNLKNMNPLLYIWHLVYGCMSLLLVFL